MGATPLSTPTAMRGKSVDGNTATGMEKARYTPAAISVRMTKMMGREKRAVQCSLLVVGVIIVVVVIGVFFGFDGDFGFVIEAEAARRDHFLAFIHTAQDLHSVALANADGHFVLVR